MGIEKPVSEILTAQRSVPATIWTEVKEYQDKGKPWGIYKSSASDYWVQFSTIDGVIPFSDALHEALVKGKKPLVFDAFSDGEAIRTMEGVKGGLALTLVDFRTEEQKRRDAENNIQVITGDFHQFETVLAIQDYLHTQDMKGFPVITARPIGGWTIIGKSPKMIRHIVNRLWSLLDPEKGKLYIALPTGSNFGPWVEEFKKAGIHAHCHKSNLFLERSPEAPLVLPNVVRCPNYILPQYTTLWPNGIQRLPIQGPPSLGEIISISRIDKSNLKSHSENLSLSTISTINNQYDI